MVTERRGVDPPEPPEGSVEELRDAIAARDELLAVVGHELRNAMAPLCLLAAHFEMMPATDDMMRAKVAMLSRNLKSFTDILDRVSEVTQLREGKLALDCATFDAQDVAREVVDELTPLARAGSSELRLDAHGVVGTWDRERLVQIVRHLVHNAIRYAGGGPIDIRVREAGAALEIVVQDVGPGIVMSERDQLFERFERKGARRNGGLGVGLWVVKSLCNAMGGTVGLGETMRGACFIVTLPRG